ncbi:MAG: hypothetical protein WAN16_05970, partial [Chthoniobacterales bacterium]
AKAICRFLWRCSLERDRCGYRPALAPSKISKWHSAAFMGFNQRFLKQYNAMSSRGLRVEELLIAVF